jgi:hypothetical protein
VISVRSALCWFRDTDVAIFYSVPTIGYQTNEFPAFFSPHSGCDSPARMDTAEQVALAYWAARALSLTQGMLVAVPNHDSAGAKVERAIQEALTEAEQQNIHGQAVTPFILKMVAEKTQGESLRSNMALVQRNAEVGADIAIAIASSRGSGKLFHEVNVNHHLAYHSETLSNSIKNLSFLDRSGDVRMSPLSPEQPVRSEVLEYATFLVIDGHTPKGLIQSAAKRAYRAGVDLVFIPSGLPNAIAATQEEQFMQSVKYAIVDVEELLAIGDGWSDSYDDVEFASNEEDLSTVKAAASQSLKKMDPESSLLLIMLGEKGVLMASRQNGHKPLFREYPSHYGVEINKRTASGDCLCGAFLQLLMEGRDHFHAASESVEAVDSLLSSGKSVYPLLSQFQAKH